MKINSVMSLEAKTRIDELYELLGQDGKISKDIDDAVIKIRNEVNPEDEDKWWKLLDKNIEQYVQLRIELDRLERSK